MFQQTLHRIHNALLQLGILPLRPKHLITPTRVPSRRIYTRRQQLLWVTLNYSILELGEVFADGVDDELRRYEAGDEEDAFVGCGGVGEGEDVG